MKSIISVPTNERPYEKCFEKGPEFLSDTELLAIILRCGTNGISAYDLANQIMSLNSNNNLLTLMHLNKEQLMNIKGVGIVKTVQILAITELAKRIATISKTPELKFSSPASIADYFMEKMRHLEQENLYVIYLDAKCQLIKEVLLTKGTINCSLISPRDILAEAFKCMAINFILVHNHPSGDCTPSKSDIAVTKRVYNASKIMDLNLLDHIIIGDIKFTSMKEEGLLS